MLLCFAWETDDDIAAQGSIRQALANFHQELAVIGSVIVSPHPFQDIVITGLRTNMQVRADNVGIRHEIEQTIRHFARIERAQAKARD